MPLFPDFRRVDMDVEDARIHDRRGRVAHRMAIDHPDAVERIAVLDIAPTLVMYEQTTEAFAASSLSTNGAAWPMMFAARRFPLAITCPKKSPTSCVKRWKGFLNEEKNRRETRSGSEDRGQTPSENTGV